MTIVKHPTLEVSKDVPAGAVPEWVAVGWVADSWAGSVTDEKPRPVKRSRRKK